MFLQTVAEEDASGAIAEVYRKEKAGAGFVPEAARCLSTRPDMPPLFDAFFDGIKANFSLSGRDWCLITFVAATHLSHGGGRGGAPYERCRVDRSDGLEAAAALEQIAEA